MPRAEDRMRGPFSLWPERVVIFFAQIKEHFISRLFPCQVDDAPVIGKACVDETAEPVEGAMIGLLLSPVGGVSDIVCTWPRLVVSLQVFSCPCGSPCYEKTSRFLWSNCLPVCREYGRVFSPYVFRCHFSRSARKRARYGCSFQSLAPSICIDTRTCVCVLST